MVICPRIWIVPIGILLIGCGGSPAPMTVAAEGTAAPTVAFTLLKKEHLSREVVLTGEFRAYQAADLHAKIAGFLRQIRVDAGSFVRFGEVLATVEVPEMDSDIAQTVAERRRTEAELGRAQAEVGRAAANLSLVNLSLNRLLAADKAEPGIIAQQEIDEAKARKAAAEAQVASAKAAIGVEESRIGVAKAGEQRSQTMSGYRTITAPFDGVVVKRYADVGALAQATPVLRVADVSRLRLAVQIPESVVPLVKVGSAVAVKVRAINKKFGGRVARLTGDVAAATRTMEVEIDVANPGRELSPGMFAEVTLHGEKLAEGFTVPVTAVANGGGNRTVMVVSPAGVIEERMIKTGIESQSGFEVLEGLTPQDRIIVSNRSLLRVGQKVEARPAGDR